MDVFIEKLHVTDAEDLFNFEVENRTFFEKMVPTRGDEYYNFETFKKRHETLLKEQVIGSSYFYLIKDKHNSILGRINLVDIDKHKKIGYLGYRVGQVHTGKGIANKALKLLLEIISDEDVKQIKATTTIITNKHATCAPIVLFKTNMFISKAKIAVYIIRFLRLWLNIIMKYVVRIATVK